VHMFDLQKETDWVFILYFIYGSSKSVVPFPCFPSVLYGPAENFMGSGAS